MRKITLISFVLATAFPSMSQQSGAPATSAGPATQQGAPAIPALGVPPGAATGPNTPTPAIGSGANTNPAATDIQSTNQLSATSRGLQPTNNTAQIISTNPALQSALELTNRLSVMDMTQVQDVLGVRVVLGALQQVALNINGEEGLLITIQHNPAVRQQVGQVSDRILSLARGQARPTRGSVDRLSLDLLRASSHARLARDQQLILAVVINLVCNSDRLSATDVDGAINNGLAVFSSAGATPSVCNSLGCDLRSIALEEQPNLGI